MLIELKSKLSEIMHKDKFPLFAVVAFSIFICLALIIINSSSNILGHNYRDAYLYLIQAYHFAGTPIGGYDYVNYYSPLIPFLTSLLFRLGFVSEASLFAVTGLFYPIAVIGIYFLLNLRFNKFYSMLGAILYGSMSINLMWTANGTFRVLLHQRIGKQSEVLLPGISSFSAFSLCQIYRSPDNTCNDGLLTLKKGYYWKFCKIY